MDRFFTMNGQTYLTDQDTLGLLRESIPSARQTQDWSAVTAVMSLGLQGGRIVALVARRYVPTDRDSAAPELHVADPKTGDVVYLHDDRDGSWLPLLRRNLDGYVLADPDRDRLTLTQMHAQDRSA